MGRTKLGMSLYTYDGDIWIGLMTVKEAVEHAASIGVEGIEVVDKMHIPNYPHPTAYDLLDLRDYIESFGMKMSCYSFYVDDYIYRWRKPTMEEKVKQVQDALGTAKVLGAPVARVAGGLDSMVPCIPLSKKYGVKMGMEIHSPIPPRMMIERAQTFEPLKNGDIGLIPDFSCWAGRGGKPTEEGAGTLKDFEDVMPYTIHVHGKAFHFNENGEDPNIPYKELLTILKEAKIGGYISAEFEGYVVADYRGRAKEIAKTHVELIKRYLS